VSTQLVFSGNRFLLSYPAQPLSEINAASALNNANTVVLGILCQLLLKLLKEEQKCLP
jgi:hypothetical protein